MDARSAALTHPSAATTAHALAWTTRSPLRSELAPTASITPAATQAIPPVMSPVVVLLAWSASRIIVGAGRYSRYLSRDQKEVRQRRQPDHREHKSAERRDTVWRGDSSASCRKRAVSQSRCSTESQREPAG